MPEKNEQSVCLNCGATSPPHEEKRFYRRHPSRCLARDAKKDFSKKLAQGTRCIEDDDSREYVYGDTT